jgi:streptogramin lyase
MGGNSATPGEATITPIFWTPSGYSFPASYKSIIDRYIADVASASSTGGNVFSVATEYYQQLSGGSDQYIQYLVHAGPEIDVSDAFPAQGGSTGCTASSGYTACVADNSSSSTLSPLQTEIKSIVEARSLPIDDSHLYMVFFPPNVETCMSPGSTSSSPPDSCSSNVYCGYHQSFQLTSEPVIYANMPYPNPSYCADPFNGPQAPNGNSYADAAVSVISHEASESITDWDNAWRDSAGYEIGDECAYTYGTPLGSTAASKDSVATGTMYNQAINGDDYYTQDEFSDSSYSQGLGDYNSPTNPNGVSGGDTQVYGCLQRAYVAPPVLNNSPATSISPGTLVGFPGSIGSSQTTVGGTVTFANSSNVGVPITVVHWDSSGLIVWIPPTTPIDAYTLTLTNYGGSTSLSVPLTAPTDSNQKATPLFNVLATGGSTSPLATSLPLGVVQDQAGDTWFSDGSNNTIDELTAGNTLLAYPLASPASGPTGIAVDQAGNIWVTQNLSGQVTELDVAHAAPGTTNGEVTFDLSGASPDGISVDPYGNVWIGEGDSGILGEIVAGSTPTLEEWYVGGDLEGMLADPFGNVWAIIEDGTNAGVDHIVPSELPPPMTASLVTAGVYPIGGGAIGAGTEQLAIAPNGDVWFTQWGPPNLGVIIPSQTDPSQDQWTYVANYPANGYAPSGIGVDAAGNLWVTDAYAQNVFKFTPGPISASSTVSGTWTSYAMGSWMTNYPEGDEGNNLLITPAGNVIFTGYITNTSTSYTPYSAGDNEGYIGELPGVAATASSTGVFISGGTTTTPETAGSGGDTVVIPAGADVTLPSGGPFTGSIPGPSPAQSFVPPATFGTLIPGSAFSVSPQESDGLLTHLAFSKPVVVTFTFPLPPLVSAAEAEAAKLWTYDAATNTWSEAGTDAGDPGGTITVTGGEVTITLKTLHLSSFGVLSSSSTSPYTITSSNSTTAALGTYFTFPVTTYSGPASTKVKIKEKGKLPRGVKFHDNHNGTATLSGTPTSKGKRSAVGAYHMNFTATFGKGASRHVATQAFTLTIN